MPLKPMPGLRRGPPPRDGAEAPPRVAQGGVGPRRRPAEVPPAGGARRAEVHGVVDGATADRLLGWAWDAANPRARLRVALRLGGEVVAETVADVARPDLAGNGVGDGCHAFQLPLLPSWIDRRAELSVVAFGADGTERPLPMPMQGAQDAGTGGGPQLARALAALQGEQSGLRAELQALQRRTDDLPDHAAIASMRHAQDELHRKVEQLEVWLARLDARLSETDLGVAAERSGRLDVWQAALVAVLASAASAACAAIAARFLMAA